jgi:hypothetical protein
VHLQKGIDVDVLSDGSIVAFEGVVHYFSIPNSHRADEPVVQVVTFLSTSGQTQRQLINGKIASYREWFWKESAGTYGGFDFGLVRTRHESRGEGYTGFSEYANGDYLFWSSKRVWRFDRSMKERWTTSVGDLSPAEQVSPPWSRGILFTLAHRLLVMDDNGRNQQVAYFHDEVAIKRAMESPVSRVAIGQSRNGEWLIVNY